MINLKTINLAIYEYGPKMAWEFIGLFQFHSFGAVWSFLGCLWWWFHLMVLACHLLLITSASRVILIALPSFDLSLFSYHVCGSPCSPPLTSVRNLYIFYLIRISFDVICFFWQWLMLGSWLTSLRARCLLPNP